MPFVKIQKEKAILTQIDAYMYELFTEAQVRELLVLIYDSKKTLQTLLEADLEQPGYYEKDVFLKYKKLREDILNKGMEFLGKRFSA